MTVQTTIDKLREMKMTAMAENYRFQLEDRSFRNLSFDERFAMLVDIEYTSRKNNRLKRLIQNAEFDQPQVSIAGLNFQCGRVLDRELTSSRFRKLHSRRFACHHHRSYR